ncbi:MAG TPA: phosphate signaling complex protein PhoU [Candidatus Fimenecus excrementavium]|nr:phosphate signaling complex protein PhoU [Candidatus Fimenecus excrementavium]
MRTRFDMELDNLNSDMIAMGALCENAISEAMKSLFTADKTAAQHTIEEDREIDRKEKDIEALCLRLLLQQQPVARDLRVISSALKMITDMERIGDQAADIAELIRHMHLTPVSRQNKHLSKMADAAKKMVTESIDAFVKKDAALATKVLADDDLVDSLFLKLRHDIIEMIAADPGCGEEAVDVLMIAKYLERIGDHATNIAEWVLFSITGTHEL